MSLFVRALFTIYGKLAHTVNATLITKEFLEGYEGLELRGSVYNLFDKDYTSPTDPMLPNDTPWPGRSFIIELKYKF